jgi:glutamate formiminotransferase
MNWIKKHSIEFQKDKLRILISKVNWNYNKNYIKRVLEDISKEANANGIEVFVYDYNDNIPKGFWFDGLNLQINNKWTDNMIQKKGR